MAVFYNQATLSYGGVTLPSNITEGELLSGISGLKTALNSDYVRGDSLAYSVSITNSGTTAINTIKVSDNLGTYLIPQTSTNAVPLEYIDGSVMLYIDGVISTAPPVTVGTEVVFGDISIPAGANALLIYEMRVNEYANLAVGSAITNTVTISDGSINESVVSSATVPVREYSDLTIAKALCPPTVSENSQLTYTFIIQNTGNVGIDESDLVLSDIFNPQLTGIEVMLNDSLLAPQNYTYNETSGEFATLPGVISVPAATFTQSENGVVSVVPGVTVLTVTGTV